MSKVPLVIYKDGARITIGEAELYFDDKGHIAALGTITDPEYQAILQVDTVNHFSIGTKAVLGNE